MSNYEHLINYITTLTGAQFRNALPSEINCLFALRLPTSVTDFFSRYALDSYVERRIRLWTIPEIADENCKYVPGCYVAPLGYVVFGSTTFGDAYCFNINDADGQFEPPIVLISHEVIDETTSATEVVKLAKPVAKNLREFLGKFVREELDEECIY